MSCRHAGPRATAALTELEDEVKSPSEAAASKKGCEAFKAVGNISTQPGSELSFRLTQT